LRQSLWILVNIAAFLSSMMHAALVRLRSRVALLRARSDTRRNLSGRRIDSILVICHGNIYRSPFVEALVRQSPLRPGAIRSAGFHPVGGRHSPQRHQDMSREFGVALQEHVSSVVSSDDLQRADIIVLMDRYNWVRLRKLGAQPQKLVWIGALTSGPVEIPDPYHLDDAAARKVLARLQAGTAELIRILGSHGSSSRS
jgi:protein-tyrosine phosphatase